MSEGMFRGLTGGSGFPLSTSRYDADYINVHLLLTIVSLSAMSQLLGHPPSPFGRWRRLSNIPHDCGCCF